jgi:hypothetical protein
MAGDDGREAQAMEFRWIAIITLWTLLSGPVFHAANGPSRAQRAPPTLPAVKTP